MAVGNPRTGGSSGGGGGGSPDKKLTSDLDLYVTNSGDDSTSRNELGGDLAAKPFATLAAALDYLPLNRNLNGKTVTIHSSKSASESLAVAGFMNGTLKMIGAVLNDSQFSNIGKLIMQSAVLTGIVNIANSHSQIAGTVQNAGQLYLNGGRAKAEMIANNCTLTALKAEHMTYVGWSLAGNGNLATPVDFFNVQFSELIGSGASGANASAARAVHLSGGGKHILTGCSLGSSNDWALDVDGYAMKWSELGWENCENGGTFAYWSDNRWLRMGRTRILNNSSTNYDDLIVASLQYGDYMKQYGVDRPLDPAYQEITARAGGGQASATLVGRQDTLILTCATVGDSVRLLSDTDAPVMGGGAKGSIWNRGAASCNVFPPVGKKIYRNGAALATDAATALAAGAKVQWMCDNNGDYNLA